MTIYTNATIYSDILVEYSILAVHISHISSRLTQQQWSGWI